MLKCSIANNAYSAKPITLYTNIYIYIYLYTCIYVSVYILYTVFVLQALAVNLQRQLGELRVRNTSEDSGQVSEDAPAALETVQRIPSATFSGTVHP